MQRLAGKAISKVLCVTRIRAIPLVTLTLLAGGLLPTAAQAQTARATPGLRCSPCGPVIYVEPRIKYTASPLVFIVKHTGGYRQWHLVVSRYPVRSYGPSEDINLGTHRANRRGVIRFHHRKFGYKFAHFSPMNGAERWLVNAYVVHPVAGEPGPFQRVFVMHRGCGCGGR